MSPIGAYQTSKGCRRTSAVGGKADVMFDPGRPGLNGTTGCGGSTGVTPVAPYQGRNCTIARGGRRSAVDACSGALLLGTTTAGTRRSTLTYVEKVRPQFLSLRQPYSAPRFLHRWMGRKSPVNWGISIAATVLEIAELRHFSLGDGIFLRSFVLCGFSIVSKSEVPEG
jgi:hypothetical protein